MRPWWADGAWEFIKNNLRANAEVFEWGSGNSTLCLSKICRRIISVENDKRWILKQKPNNVELLVIPDDGPTNNDPDDPFGYSSASLLFNRKDFYRYVTAIDSYHSFDLIIIDGRSRTSCLAHATTKLKPKGMLLLDDPWRSHYEPGIDLIPHSWDHMHFKSVEHQTSIWVNRA